MVFNENLFQRDRAMNINKDGWCTAAQHLVSPNQNDRPPGQAIDLLVIHHISLPPGEFGGEAIADLFLNRLDCDTHPFFDQLRSLKVSSHFLIRRDGQLVQFVSTERRAWHAGVSSYRGRQSCNDFSIGIEIEGTGVDPFSSPQYATLVSLTAALCRYYPLTAVTGHEHIAPGRKTDPGPCFDWPRYRRQLEETGVLFARNLPFEFWMG